jgi:hypothetical protein
MPHFIKESKFKVWAESQSEEDLRDEEMKFVFDPEKKPSESHLWHDQ